MWKTLEFFPLAKNSKTPLEGTRGFIDAKKGTFDELCTQECNIGVRPAKRMLVVDIDPRNGGFEAERAILPIEGWPETWTVNTPGGGRHIYFLADLEKVPKALIDGIDLKSRNGYLVCPPSKIAGKQYEWADEKSPEEVEIAEAPSWLIEMIEEKVASAEKKAEDLGPKSQLSRLEIAGKRQDAILALQGINPDVGYNVWLEIGMALKSIDALDLWVKWSERGEKFKPGECERKWPGFRGEMGLATLFWHANNQVSPAPTSPAVCQQFAGSLPAKEELAVKPTGLMGEIVEEFELSTRQTDYALASAISLMSTLYQRAYEFQVPNGSLNLQSVYVILCGTSGTRKSTALNSIRKVLRQIDTRYVLGDARSAPGLKKQLGIWPSKFYSVDEYGQWLRGNIYNKHKDPHAIQIHKLLLETYGAPDFLQANHTLRKEDGTEEILQPRLTLCCTGVLKDFDALLGHPEFVSDGMLSRLLLFEGKELPESDSFDLLGSRRSVDVNRIAESLKMTIPGKALVQNQEWTPIRKRIGEKASTHAMSRMREDFLPLVEDVEKRSIVERSAYTALLISGWHSIGHQREVCEDDIDVGMDLMLGLTKRTLQRLAENEGGELEKAVSFGLAFIRKNPGLTWREVQKCVKAIKVLRPDEAKLVKTYILDSGEIFEQKSGRRKTLHHS